MTQQSLPPAVGNPTPDFSLPDSTGLAVTLSEFRRRSCVVLVFLRGPFWRRHLRRLAEDEPRFRDAAACVIAVAPTTPDAVRDYVARDALPFPVLADPERAVFARYGVASRATSLAQRPGLFIVDADGVVRFAHVRRLRGKLIHGRGAGRGAVHAVLGEDEKSVGAQGSCAPTTCC